MDFVIGGLVTLGGLFLLIMFAVFCSEGPSCCPRRDPFADYYARDTYAEAIARTAAYQAECMNAYAQSIDRRVAALERKSLTRYGSGY